MKTFEDCIDIIDAEINKRKSKWTFNAISWMDFEDVKQRIRIHIYQKWDKWNQKMALEPWLNRVIRNQMINITRNEYGNYARPCVSCAANQGGDLCSITPSGKQCVECPIYKKWSKSKKNAYDTKIPVRIMDLQGREGDPIKEIEDIECNNFDYDKYVPNVHRIMKKILKEKEWAFYQMVYIDNLSDEEVAERMGLVTKEKNSFAKLRKPGYKHIKNIKNRIIAKAKKYIIGYSEVQD